MSVTNQVSLLGNLGADPVERGKTADGTPVVGFALAQRSSGAEAAQWFNVTCFADLAERAREQLKKGDQVLVTGELRSSSYTNKNGERRAAVEISARDVLRVSRLRKVDSVALDATPV